MKSNECCFLIGELLLMGPLIIMCLEKAFGLNINCSLISMLFIPMLIGMGFLIYSIGKLGQ